MEIEKIYENCRENLIKLNDWYKGNLGKRNEADTRLHLVDDLLKNCLNWKKNDINSEERYNGKYTDYTVRSLRPVFILEAKKEGIFFELPAGFSNIKCSIKSLIEGNDKIKAALEQVSKYCQERGVKIGVVSNGWQIIVFIANRQDGIPPLEGEVYVFNSLDKMLENFKDLWNLLSPEGTKDGSFINKLYGDDIPQVPPKLSSAISPHYPGIKNRNQYQSNMQIISDLILEDVIKHEKIKKIFLEECYCKSGALSQYALISKAILKTRYENLLEKNTKDIDIESVVTKKGISPEFIDIFEYGMSSRPILLIGDVGSGKSIFIENLINVEAKKIFDKSITLLIDLGAQAIIDKDMKSTIVKIINNQLLDNYKIDIEEDAFVRGVYCQELQRFKKSVIKKLFEINKNKALEEEVKFLKEEIKNKVSHLKRSLDYIHGRGKQVIIFIDNCDQRSYESQQKAFLISEEIAHNWSATVFISLRPETFHKSVKSGSLSGYHTKAFTISPPKVEDVLQKRLNFAQKIAMGEISLSRTTSMIKTKKVSQLIDVLKYSLEENDELLELIENISCGNIRKAIDLVKNFMGSGHVDTEKILKIDEDSKKENKTPYLIPRHEFLRAVIYGDNVYYEPNSSPFTNLFDIHSCDEKEHFLLSIFLSILVSFSNTGRNNGFLETKKIYNQLQRLGYTIDQINYVLDFANEKHLFETSSRGKKIDIDNLPIMLRVTSAGAYHVCILCKLFTYIDAIIVDTPIVSKPYNEKIEDVMNVKKRLQRGEIFIEYLDLAWKKIKNGKLDFEWPRISHLLKGEIKKINSIIEEKQKLQKE